MRNFALFKNKQSKGAPQTEPPPSPKSKAVSPWPPTGSLQNVGTDTSRMSGSHLPSVQKKRHLSTLQEQGQVTGKKSLCNI